MQPFEEAIAMRLTEELILLMLDEDSGYLEMVPSWDFACVMAGAVIADLALESRIDTDLDALHVISDAPTGDALLDPTLQEISEASEDFSAQYWIERSTTRSEEIVTMTLDRLVEKGILDYETGGFWTLSREVNRSGVYPAGEGETLREAKSRVLSTVLNRDIPDPRDAILVGLMHTCDGFRLILSEEDYQESAEWIETLVKMDLVGRMVHAAVTESAFRPKTRRVIPTKPIPKLGFGDILRERDFRTGNIPQAMWNIGERHGPVVELPFRMAGQRVVALIGPKTNHWVNRHGRFYLRSKDYIEGLEHVFGASRTLPGMDGPEHHKLRKAFRGAYSRAALAERIQQLVGCCRERIGTWQEGDVFSAAETFQQYVSSQVSDLLLGVECGHYVDELLEYEHRALVTQVQGAMPKFMLSTPKMRRARKRVAELQDAIHASHTPAQRRGKTKDLADAVLELNSTDPQMMPETDMVFPFVASMVASLYLGSALGFAAYAMVRHPDLYAAVRREADALFGNGDPSGTDFNRNSVDVTHRLFLESERLYPVIPWQLRTVMNQCVVEGFELPTKTRLLICQTASHYSGEIFDDPTKFDVDRYLPGREEHMAQGAYAPYGLGTHTCLGHRWVELQMVVNLMLIAHHVSLEIVPEDYQLRINPFPTSAPNRKLKFRVTEIRNRV